MAIKPLGERVLLKQLEGEEKTAGGLYIPDNAKEKPQQAEVIAIGEEVKEIAAGDKVLYGKYAGTEISHEGETFLIMKSEDVLAVIS